jgi:hypothetical protein
MEGTSGHCIGCDLRKRDGLTSGGSLVRTQPCPPGKQLRMIFADSNLTATAAHAYILLS